MIQEYGRKNLDEGGILWNATLGGPGHLTKYFTEEERINGRRERNKKRYYRKHEEIRKQANAYRSQPKYKEKNKEYYQKKRMDLEWVEASREYSLEYYKKRGKFLLILRSSTPEGKKKKKEKDTRYYEKNKDEINRRIRERYHKNKDEISRRRKELYAIKKRKGKL